MKIGIDARFWNESGVGRYIRNIVDNLDQENLYVLFVLKKDKNLIEAFLENKHTNISVVIADVPWHSVVEQLSFKKIIEKEKIDLMHFTYFSVPVSYSAPFVLTIHDLILHHFPTGKASTRTPLIYYLKWFGYKSVIKIAAKKASHIITVSNASKEEIVDHLGVEKEKISVIYEGVEQGLTQEKKEKSENNYFLHVGNVYPHKNAKKLIQAFSQIEDPTISLVFAGAEDFFMNELKQYVKSNAIKNIRFEGFVSDNRLTRLYKNARGTVVPSLMEGFGLPAVEAMANSCLVIVSDIPSLREVTQAQALFFDPHSIISIASVLKAVANTDKKQYASLIDKAHKIALSYSWEKASQQTIAIYESCDPLRQNK